MARYLVFLLFAIWMLPQIAYAQTETDKSSKVKFELQGKEYEAELPQGFCLPKGERQEFLALYIAAIDEQNSTALTFFDCQFVEKRYILVKTPRKPSSIPFSKAVFLRFMASYLKSEAGKEAISEGAGEGARLVDEGTGGTIGVEISTVGYSAADEECVYISGPVSASDEHGVDQGFMGSCATLKSSNQIMIYTYDYRDEPNSVKELEALARTVSLQISPRQAGQ